jgi:hypothetical protein
MSSPLANFLRCTVRQPDVVIVIEVDNAAGHQLSEPTKAGKTAANEDFVALWLQMQDSSTMARINEMETHKKERWGSHYTRWSWPVPTTEQQDQKHERRQSDCGSPQLQERPPPMPQRQRSISDEDAQANLSHTMGKTGNENNGNGKEPLSDCEKPLPRPPMMPQRHGSTGEREKKPCGKVQKLQRPPRIPLRQNSSEEETPRLVRSMAA